MAAFSQYPEYKSSGLDCFGDIPRHWKVIPIKFALDIPITDGPHTTPIFYPDGIPFLSAEAVKNDRLDFDKKRGFISKEDHELFSKKYKPKFGDVYMVKSGATTGAVARVLTDEEFNIWSPLAVLRPHPEKAITDFIFFVLKSKPFFYSVEQSWSYGTQQNIGMGIISNIRMALPPVEEQKAIAHFLDFKTVQIDALIAKKKALLNKLAEKRTALISHAVTKGLDPSVPMKPSGVEWLGVIPQNWKSISIRWLIRIGSGDFISNADTEFDWSEETPVSVVGGNGVMAYTNQVNTPKDCIVIGRVGAHCGNVHFIKAPSWITDNALRVSIVSHEVTEEFLMCALKAINLNDFANKNAQPLITGEMVKSKKIALPPVVEQIAICRHIKSIEAYIKSQIEKTQLAIDKLIEYRAALITNAVTGKIDVRDFVAPTTRT